MVFGNDFGNWVALKQQALVMHVNLAETRTAILLNYADSYNLVNIPIIYISIGVC